LKANKNKIIMVSSYSRRALERSCLLLVVATILYCIITNQSLKEEFNIASQEEKTESPTIRRRLPREEKENATHATTFATTLPQLVPRVKCHYESKHNKAFVNYWLESDKPYSIKFGKYMRCKVEYGRVELYKPFAEILNVTTYLQTNLKIITVGDSVGMQFHHVLEEALEPPPLESKKNNQTYHTLYHDAWGRHEMVTVSAPVRGGGAIASLRMNGYLMPEGKRRPVPNSPPHKWRFWGGWNPVHVQEILNHNYSVPSMASDNIGNGTETTHTNQTVSETKRIDAFDVMIYRIPHGWIPIEKVKRDWILKSVLFARELFGVRTIILPSLFFNVSYSPLPNHRDICGFFAALPINTANISHNFRSCWFILIRAQNNINTTEQLDELRNKRRMMRELVEESWTNSSMPNLLQLDIGDWTDQLTELNAKLIGINILERLKLKSKYPPSVAMVCAKMPDSTKNCPRNMISKDGMHWCMESLGGRYVGGISCLLQCALMMDDFNQTTTAEETTISDSNQKSLIGKCQQRCNDQFMSLRPAASLFETTPINPKR